MKMIKSEFAEFYGIMLGDGCSQRNQITIGGGTIDGTYITQFIPNIINNLFSKKVRYKKQCKESFDCIFSSIDVYKLLKEFGFVSPKINCVIPEQFKIPKMDENRSHPH